MFKFMTGPMREAPTDGGGGGAGEHPVAPWATAQQGQPWSIGEGDKAKPWWNAIPDEPVRNLLDAKKYANPTELAMAYHNLNKLQNGAPDVLALPGKDATDAQWNDFYTKLGRPTDKAAYDIKFPDSMKTDTTGVDFAKGLAFDLGLSPKQAQKMADKWGEFVTSTNTRLATENQTKNATELAALEAKWGARTSEYKAAGERVVKALGLSAETLDKIDRNIGVASLVELLATIGMKSAEGKMVDSGQNTDPNNPDTMTKEQAAARIAQLQGDTEFQKKYTDKAHPEHAAAVDIMLKLHAKA